MTTQDLDFLVELVDNLREAADILVDAGFEQAPDDLCSVADDIEVIIADES